MIAKFRILIAGIILTVTTYAQDTIITKSWKNTSIVTVKKDIERITGYQFWDSTEVDFNITYQAQNKPLSNVLTDLFSTRGYSIRIIKNTIAIKKAVNKTSILHGRVLNRKNEAVSYATVHIKGTPHTTSSDEQGKFSLSFPSENFTIIITAIGYKDLEKRVNTDSFVTVILDTNISSLAQISVKAKKKSQAPSMQNDSLLPNFPTKNVGSISIIDSSQLGWSASPYLIERLPSGIVLHNSNITPGSNQSPIVVRNRITINGFPHCLIILNGIPYLGDLNQINPNDIQSIEVLKDAAASTQYGIFSGNGVIIIITQNSSFNKQTKVSATANFTIGLKPDLFDLPYMTSADHIDITRSLFDSGYYDHYLYHTPWLPVPPPVKVLNMKKLGLITNAEAEAALNKLRNTDIRDEAYKHLHQTSLQNQYHIGIQGGNNVHHYYFSQGYDFNRSNLTGNNYTRFTINLNNTVKTSRKGPEIFNGIYGSQSVIHMNGIGINNFLYPYEKLTDEHGNALSVTKTIDQTYKDSIVQATSLLNWDYKPLNEIRLGNNKMTKTALHITLGIKYKFLKKVEVSGSYRNETEISAHVNRHSEQSYFTRDFINQLTQINTSGGLYRPVPLGAIVDKTVACRIVNNVSAQIKYDAVDNQSNSLIFYSGTEIRHLKCYNKTQRDYGVTENGTKAIVNHTALFSTPYDPGRLYKIPNIDDRIDTMEHYYSFYANGVYSWKKKMTASISFRKDESNIFGVHANQKGVPLLAAGISWDLSNKNDKHRFYSLLRLRLSSGYCSNASKSVSSLTGLQTIGTNPWNAPVSAITNPSNPRLSWETVHISNIGMDFSLLNNSIWGSTDFFVKQGNNLLGQAPIDPTSGVGIFQGNVAAMNGHGIEVALNSKTGNKKFQWQSAMLFSYVRDRVTKYSIQRPSIWYYCDPRYINPIPGLPLFSVYSLPFLKLDANGDPIGILNNQFTKDYNTILQSPDLSDLIYHGPATPSFYGSFRNSISWHQFELGFNIVWKAGYYFRTNSINYNAVITGESIGHSDITQRWRLPGDEYRTNIPSLRFPIDNSRDLFFNYSSALVEKGDHIRLQDVRLKFYLNKMKSEKNKRPLTELYFYVNNLGVIWKANRKGIDPDYVNSLPLPLQFTFGTKVTF